MRICLVSDLPEFCSTLNEHGGTSLLRVSPEQYLPEADLYVWDYHPDNLLRPEALKQNAQYLVLAHPKDIPTLVCLERVVCVLLKPVNADTLRACVDLALKTWKLREQACLADTLRLDRDTLLQYVLEVNVKLQEYDHERSNFLARALHDLRTPLTALHGYCGLLVEEKLGELNLDQRELLERMRNSTTRLTRLATGTLDLLLQGRFDKPPSYKPNDIGLTITRALQDVEPFVQDKNIQVGVQIEPIGARFLFEAEKIQQVFVNLLENSCKFVPRNGSIGIRGYPLNWRSHSGGHTLELHSHSGACDAYRVDINDSGPGVPPELVEKIFEQYASYAGSHDRSGGGLGLAICRQIVGAHRGRIWATPGEGAQFSIVLPFQESKEDSPKEESSEEPLVVPESVGCETPYEYNSCGRR